MDLHLVGGFLGSGKTTAIIGAIKGLLAQQKKVGVITNDQGKYLVDTAFFRFSEVPTVEVTGGCFCCNYDDLDKRLDQLAEAVRPDVIFAKSVGSCADIVATVVKPLLSLRRRDTASTSFSVFADSRLLRMRLLGLDLPFNEDVIYIFDKQIEEAGLLVINKADLLLAGQDQELAGLVRSHFPNKPFIFQDSRQPAQVQRWLEVLNSTPYDFKSKPLEVDYARYGAGEARLAWLDEKLVLKVIAGQADTLLIYLIQAVVDAVQAQRLPVGHLKFFIQSHEKEVKVSFPTLTEDNWEDQVRCFNGADEIQLLINGRIEVKASILKDLIQTALEKVANSFQVEINQVEIDYFHPGFPRPTYRDALNKIKGSLMEQKPLKLMIPGPIQPDRAVLDAMGGPIVPHYGPQFTQIYNETLDFLKQVFNTGGNVFLLPGAGSAGTDACIGSALSTGDKIIVGSNGFFGDRLITIADSYGLEIVPVTAEWGQPLRPQDFEEAFHRHPNARASAIVHLETSTAVVNPVAEVAAITRQAGR